VGGVPAKPIRKRFSDETISALLTERWWDWPEEKIARNLAASNRAVSVNLSKY
jgi:virginiamycin A acetyltransferase